MIKTSAMEHRKLTNYSWWSTRPVIGGIRQQEKERLRIRVKTIDVPGWGSVKLENLVLDLNGTLTESGDFIPGVVDYLEKLKAQGFRIYILSADTRGVLQQTFKLSPDIEAVVAETAEEKKRFVESIGAETTVCVGNGNIDVEMFKVAKLSICTVQAEGATTKAMLHGDIVVAHIKHALEILLDPDKLIATLRY
jgi:soluble P-type ATPase